MGRRSIDRSPLLWQEPVPLRKWPTSALVSDSDRVSGFKTSLSKQSTYCLAIPNLKAPSGTWVLRLMMPGDGGTDRGLVQVCDGLTQTVAIGQKQSLATDALHILLSK